MKKTRSTLITASLCAFIGTASAQVNIRGMQSCGAWVADHASSDKIGQVLDEMWLVGFLSGMAYESNKNVLIGVDNPSIFLWMSNFCRANPLKNLVDGAGDLFQELARNKGIK